MKAVVEQELLGGLGPAVTDVTGPPTAVFAQRLELNPGDTTIVPLAALSPAPAPAPAEHEVFFMNPVHRNEPATALPQTLPEPVPDRRPTVARGPLIFLGASLAIAVAVGAAVIRQTIIRASAAQPTASATSPLESITRTQPGIASASASASPPAPSANAARSSHR